MGKMNALFVEIQKGNMNNYPPGAESDPEAPYNKPDYGTKECPECQGTGMDQCSNLTQCSECLGTGRVPWTIEDEEAALSSEIEAEEDAKREEKID